MALANLNLAQGPQVATYMLSTIVPKNFHTFPAVIGSLADANVNSAKPRYAGAGATSDWQGGAVGDDVDVATANTQAIGQNNVAFANYAPRNQAQKAALMVPPGTLAVDISRARGWIAPLDPYAGHSSPPAAPVITSLSPNTAVAVTGPEVLVTITGTGFTPWSTVLSGNFPIPSKYVDATHLTIYQNPKASVAGVVQVVVIDHDVNSAPSNFTFT